MKEKKNVFKIAGDMIYSILGLVAMNGVLQLLLYPSIEKKLGSDVFGNVQVVLSLVSILATMFGTAANYGRMVAKKNGRSNNGDFNIFLLLTFPVAIIASIVCVKLVFGSFDIALCILVGILSIISILRYYGDVEYRLNVNFKRFFIYYLLIAAGYAVGTLFVVKNFFGQNNSWAAAMILGEALCVMFVGITGGIFKGKDLVKASEYFKQNFGTILFLVGSNFINAIVLKGDAFILKGFYGSEAVTVFYVATLVGKIIALLTTPLNGIIIGYLTNYKGKIDKKFFTVATFLGLGVGLLFTACCLPVSHIFVKLMYSEETYNLAKGYFLLANAGQVLYFISGSMMVVVLRFTHERWQLIINMIYAALYVAVVVPLTGCFGIMGITWGILIVNSLRFLMVITLGYINVLKGKESNEKKD